MSALDVAGAQYAAQSELAAATAESALQMWAEVDPFNLSASWARFTSRLSVILRGAQLASATPADAYVDRMLREQGINVAPGGRVAARALSGIASDGRPLDGLLDNPVIAAKEMIARGETLPRAMATGGVTLKMTIRTQVADAGRVATGVAIAARPRTGYTRMVVGDSCPRCIILAGRFYRYSTGFDRHPQCDCINIPSAEATADDFTTDPKLAFEQGRVKGLTVRETQAIRDGADMAQVVNAKAGMYVAGARKFTSTGTTRHALAGRRLGLTPRLMPEQIYRDAGTSRETALRLLRQHGYLI